MSRRPTLRQLAKAATASGISWLQPTKSYPTRKERDMADRKKPRDLTPEQHNARAARINGKIAVKEALKTLMPVLRMCKKSLNKKMPTGERERVRDRVCDMMHHVKETLNALRRANNRLLW